ncbi:DNA damage-regulated autophagy modulator protein 2 isoform X2 [Galendromus occidentalis]|nr:DNA damage-regulated autophagy modulator protein 2 isoform X2 [Galendromus occidentalis]
MSAQYLRFPPPRWFPFLATASLFLTCATSVTLAFHLKQVSGIPYISDTITTPPESCYFGLFLNIYALLLGISIWNVYTLATDKEPLETVACCVGLTAAFGVAVVANFQETVVFPVHILGAMLALGFASVYIGMRVILSPCYRHLRAVCAIGCAVCFVVCSVTGGIAFTKFK